MIFRHRKKLSTVGVADEKWPIAKSPSKDVVYPSPYDTDSPQPDIPGSVGTASHVTFWSFTWNLDFGIFRSPLWYY